ncbi:MAG: helix-turn-helix transcriptional regulator [Ruminococcaceae bacterium]|nr:helix-turn-helix transcriptional regulator [Oscillospiraceae bacterium]
MSIGTVIRNLRHEKHYTQEQLADMLCVSASTISQWECNRTAPDISQLPTLANIFEVSADILLEIDIAKSKRAKEINDFEKECDALYNQGKNEERLELCRSMIKKYPNDETVMYQLMRVLKITRENECYNEIVDLGERLISSNDPDKRYHAIRWMCLTHEENNNHSEALRYAGMIPSNKDLFIHILDGKEMILHCQKYFKEICNNMFLYANSLAYLDNGHYTPRQKHIICKKLYDIFHIIHEDSDFDYMDHDRMGRLCFRMAQDSAVMEEKDQAVEELEKMLYHFDKMSEFDNIKHSSLLVNTLSSDIKDIRKKDTRSIYTTFYGYLNDRLNCFESIIDEPGFLKIKNILKEKSDN